jgi:hypothetical protein
VALKSAASISKPGAADRKPLGKIAMEEHFMVPGFMEYFAQTYPNINADIAKLAPGALMDFGLNRQSARSDDGQIFVAIAGSRNQQGGTRLDPEPDPNKDTSHLEATIYFITLRAAPRICSRSPKRAW